MLKFFIPLFLITTITPAVVQAQTQPTSCAPADQERLNRTAQIGGVIVFDPHYWIQTINRRVETPHSLHGIMVCAGRQAQAFALEAQGQTGQVRADSLHATEASRAIMVAVGEAIKYVTGQPNRVSEYPEQR